MLAPGQLIIQGKGAPPRKVMAHPALLPAAIGGYGGLSFDVCFMPYDRWREPTVKLTYHLHRHVPPGTPSAADFLRSYLREGGWLDVGELEVSDRRVLELHERAVRRAAVMMQRVADRLAAQGLFGEQGPEVLASGHQVHLVLAPTEALLGGGEADPAQVGPRYCEWLEACLGAFFDSDPAEPVARFVAEAVMPAVGRF